MTERVFEYGGPVTEETIDPRKALAARLTALLAVDTSCLSGPEYCAHMGEFEAIRTRLEAEHLARLADFDESGCWAIDAAHGTANWMATHTGADKTDARGRVRLAQRLRQMPGVAAALAAGEITVAHARVLARCVINPRTRAFFPDDEPTLVGLARTSTPDQLANHVRAWIELMDQDGPVPQDPAQDTCSAARVGDRVRITSDLGLDTGLPLLAAIEERSDVLFERDKRVAAANPDDGLGMRTPGNRRAEALVELVMAGAGAEANPRRREPLFDVLVDALTLRTMERRADSTLELTDGSVIPIQLAHLWGCDALMQRVVLDRNGAVLDLGRAERYATKEQRRALDARDRGCAVPGCGRPSEFCDAHHLSFWEDGGSTDLDNLVLLCRHHHRAIHHRRLHVEMERGRPTFADGYGRRIEAGRYRPPPEAAAA